MNIRFFSTGGTIDKIYFDAKSNYEVGDSYLENMLRRANVSFDYSIDQLLRKDSLDLADEDRQMIYDRVESCQEEYVIITHGTDTMAKTGIALQSIREKTIVLTGSMQPARFHESDAIFNIGTAVGAVQSMPHGVYLAINGMILDPGAVIKNIDQNRFEKTEPSTDS